MADHGGAAAGVVSGQGSGARARLLALLLALLVALVVSGVLVGVVHAHGSSAATALPAAAAAAAAATVPTLPPGTVTVSPQPGSRTADPATQISFLGRPAGSLGSITVVGSKSGAHPGRLLAYSTGDGASFVPDHPFVAGEAVTVHTGLPIVGATKGTFHFVVADVVPLTAPPSYPASRTNVAGVDHFASAPTLEAPVVKVLTPATSPIPKGDFLLAPKGTTGVPGPMIVRPDGQLVWFEPLPDHEEAFDLNEQVLHGKPVLTWFQGIVVHGHGEGEAVIADRSYKTIAVVHGGNGVQVDLHDLQLTNQGTVFVTAYRTMRWNLTPDGGAAQGTVFDGVIQEIDVKTGLVEEEWDSLDHVPVSASDFRAPSSPTNPFDYFHVNAVQPLAGGEMLVSSRNTSAAFLVDPADDGAVLWQLGGKASSFAMGPGTEFWYEHDVRLHPGNLVTVFDDGAAPAREPASRVLEIHLDTTTHRAILLHAFTHSGGQVLAAALGNVQSFPGGDLGVGWGTAPYYSVLGPSGQTLYDAALPEGDDSYRSYLATWSGAPTTAPSLALSRSGSGATVSMSWNGATGVAHWAILSGASRSSLHEVARVADTGFETAAHVQDLGAYVQVAALGIRGRMLGRSAVSPG